MNKKIVNNLLEIFPFAIVFLLTFKYPIVPDIGWHLKNGEYLITKGQIVDTNFYSTMMDGFRYINSSWLLDGVLYIVFRNFSFVGIAALSAICFTLIFYVLARTINMDYWQKLIVFPVVLYCSNILTGNGAFRAQTISLLFMVLVVYFLVMFAKNKKLMTLLIPITMFLWVQMHGQFIVGLLIICIWIFSEIIKEIVKTKKIDVKNYIYPVTILVGSFLATLINPYGINIYKVVFLHFGNSSILSKVSEWEPSYYHIDTAFVFFILIFLYLITFFYIAYRRNITKYLFFILLPLPFMWQAIFHVRYLVITLFLIVPFFGLLVNDLRIKEFAYSKYSFLVGLTIVYIYIIYSFPLSSFVRNNWDYYCLKTGCSDEAARYLIDNNLQDKLFTQYVLGGWLIWNHYPEIKPSIDGRMHMWEENGYSAFLESYDYLKGNKDINSAEYEVVYILKLNRIYDVMLSLVEEGKWEMVYDDVNSSIFVRAK